MEEGRGSVERKKVAGGGWSWPAWRSDGICGLRANLPAVNRQAVQLFDWLLPVKTDQHYTRSRDKNEGLFGSRSAG